MHRQSSRPARGTLTGLATAAIALATACLPNTNVKPGAPVLTEVSIIENGSSVTTIAVGTPDCPAGTAEGTDCDLSISLCRSPSDNNWCRCIANTPPSPPATCMTDAGAPDAGADASTDDAGGAEAAPTPPPGSWTCPPFAPNSTVLFVFDRLLYTPTLDPGTDPGRADLATATIMPVPASSITTSTDYSPNGLPNTVLVPLFGFQRIDGPNLLVAAQPELTGGATVNVTLDKTKVLAKDGKTAFSAPAPFANGVAFNTAAFGAAFTAMPTPPDDGDPCTPPLTDAVPDATSVVLTFNNPVDVEMMKTHISVTSHIGNGPVAAVAVDISSMDGVNFTIAPTAMGNWPASSSIDVAVDAAAADLVGETLGTPVTTSFTTSAQ